MELNNDDIFKREEPTRDGEKRINYVHSEISYFVFGKLNRRRVDLTVVNPANFDYRKRKVIYKKGYYFSEPSIGIELKLNKNKSKRKVKEELIDVLDDLVLLARSRPESKFYLLQLDKKNRFSEDELDQIQNDYPDIKLFYASAS